MKMNMSSLKKLTIGIIVAGLFTTSIEAATLKGLNQNNTTLVPLRIISQELGAQVDYKASNKEITINYNDSIILTTIGSKKATVNGSSKELRVAPRLINNTSYVPLRFIGEALGAIVDYNKGNLTITLGNQVKEWTLETTTNISNGKIIQEEVPETEFVATINGKPLTQASYKGYLFNAKAELEQNFGPNIWDLEVEGESTENIAKERALESAIAMSVTSAKAKEMKLKLTLGQKEEAKIITANYVEQEKEALAVEGISEDVIREMIEDIILSQNLMEELANNFIPAEDPAFEKFAEQYKINFETVTAQHVLLSTIDDQGNSLPQGAIKKKAEEVLKKALAGEDMGQLAKKYSDDPGSKDQGGEYTFPRGQMVKEFEDAAFSGQAGQIHPELIKTDYGYHIIKTIKKTSPTETEMKEAFEKTQQDEYISSVIDEWINAAKIEKTSLYDKIKIRY